MGSQRVCSSFQGHIFGHTIFCTSRQHEPVAPRDAAGGRIEPRSGRREQDCIAELMPEVELRVREVDEDALKFQRHSRRPQLDPTHINQASQVQNLEVPYH